MNNPIFEEEKSDFESLHIDGQPNDDELDTIPAWRPCVNLVFDSAKFVVQWAVLWAIILAVVCLCGATRSPGKIGRSWKELFGFYLFAYPSGLMTIILFTIAEKIESQKLKNTILATGVFLIAVIITFAVLMFDLM